MQEADSSFSSRVSFIDLTETETESESETERRTSRELKKKLSDLKNAEKDRKRDLFKLSRYERFYFLSVS